LLRLGSAVDMVEEHLQYGVKMPNPPVTAGLVGLLLGEQTANQRGKDVDVARIRYAGGD
jgi:xanthosine utilization system XapX-like protein